jgi:hypothetical protein
MASHSYDARYEQGRVMTPHESTSPTPFLGLHQRRQLDQHGFLAKGLSDLQTLAAGIQAVVFQILLKETSRLIHHEERTQGVKSLGVEKLRIMMMAKKKRRWYDQDPVSHQAVSQVYFLNPTEQKRMGVHLFLSVQATQQYVKQCFNQGRALSHDAVHSIVETIFNWETQSLQQRYQALLRQPLTASEQPSQTPQQAPTCLVKSGLKRLNNLGLNSGTSSPAPESPGSPGSPGSPKLKTRRVIWVDEQDDEELILRGQQKQAGISTKMNSGLPNPSKPYPSSDSRSTHP